MASVSAGVARYADIFKAGAILNTPTSGVQSLPSLTPAEQSAATAALAKIGVSSTTTPPPANADSVVVGSGNATLLGSTAHHPVITSSIGSDTVVTGSIMQGSVAPTGAQQTLNLSSDTITQVGHTADAFKAPVKPANAMMTMSDKTTINLVGVSSTTNKPH